MVIVEVLRVALDAIRTNKLRTALTMLGIVIGIAAVITMVALGEGAQRAVQAQIESLGTRVLTVRAGSGWFSRGGRSDAVFITAEEAEAVSRRSTAVGAVAPELQDSYQLEFGRANGNFRVVGTSPAFPEVNGFEVQLGRFFDTQENQGRRRVAVLGGAVPGALGREAVELVGRRVSIRNIPFEVVGVLEEKGGSGFFSQDDQVFVPVKTAQFRLMGSDRLSAFNVKVADEASLDVATMQIEEVLRQEHRLRPGEENDFWIQNRADLMGTMQETTQTFTYLLGGIAAVSLLVGGIGIMNIMLVSVTERTREIGLRKALGARRRDVLLQFLVEALALCIGGGILGILLGAGAARAFSSFAGWNTAVSVEAVLLAVLFSAAVGLFFGLWPARRAAGLDPIDALRYE